jgi:hypothetical protein
MIEMTLGCACRPNQEVSMPTGNPWLGCIFVYVRDAYAYSPRVLFYPLCGS